MFDRASFYEKIGDVLAQISDPAAVAADLARLRDGTASRELFSLAKDAAVFFLGAGSGVLPFWLASISPERHIVCFCEEPGLRADLDALAEKASLVGLVFCGTLDQAFAALTRESVDCLVVEAPCFSLDVFSGLLDRLSPDCVLGRYNPCAVSGLALYRLCVRKARAFSWTNTTTGQTLLGEPFIGPDVSLILAAGDTPSLLEEALSSLLAQSLTEKEILVFFDPALSEIEALVRAKEAASEGQLRAIPLSPYARGAAFSEGLKAASGAYVAFLDGVDSFDPDMFEALFAEGALARAQIVHSDYYTVRLTDGGLERCSMVGMSGKTSFLCRGAMDQPIELIRLEPMIGRCLYLRSFLLRGGVSFEQDGSPEDEILFQFCAASLAERAVVLPETFLYHRERLIPPDDDKDEAQVVRFSSLAQQLRGWVDLRGGYGIEMLSRLIVARLFFALERKATSLLFHPSFSRAMFVELFSSLRYVGKRDLFFQLVKDSAFRGRG